MAPDGLQNSKSHVRHIAKMFKLSYGTIWNIFRKSLNWKTYKHRSQSRNQLVTRLVACNFWLAFEEDWLQHVI